MKELKSIKERSHNAVELQELLSESSPTLLDKENEITEEENPNAIEEQPPLGCDRRCAHLLDNSTRNWSSPYVLGVLALTFLSSIFVYGLTHLKMDSEFRQEFDSESTGVKMDQAELAVGLLLGLCVLSGAYAMAFATEKECALDGGFGNENPIYDEDLPPSVEVKIDMGADSPKSQFDKGCPALFSEKKAENEDFERQAFFDEKESVEMVEYTF